MRPADQGRPPRRPAGIFLSLLPALMVQVDAAGITRALDALVRIPSVNPALVGGGAGEAEIARWLVRECERLGMQVSVEEVTSGRPNVVATLRGTGPAGG